MNNAKHIWCVLLSGGMDSAAALHFALEQTAKGGGTVVAVAFSYGQPHRDAELWAACTIANRRGVPMSVVLLPDLPKLNPEAGHDDRGISKAFVPGRNMLFLCRAAAECARPGVPMTLVIGANSDDAAGFPDCRPEFFKGAQKALRAAFAGVCDIDIRTPWVGATKSGILRWAQTRPAALEDIRDSVSCYRGTRCGQCDACTLRARAFAEVGLEDGTSRPVFCGGDPHREAAFR